MEDKPVSIEEERGREMAGSKLNITKGIVHRDPEIMGETPVFIGTRVPLQNLIDSLEGGESIDVFLDAFRSVRREQVIAVIEAAKQTLLEKV